MEKEKFVKEVFRAVEQEEKIYLFGDGDPDGVLAVLIFEQALKGLGVSCFPFFSDREKHGYGLSSHYVEKFRKKEPGLVITFDLGSNDFSGVASLKKAGFEVMIVDHHAPLGKMPEAKVMVNPARREEGKFRRVCGAGLSYHLSVSLLEKAGRDFSEDSFLELAMLATLSDRMGEEGESGRIIEKGVEALKTTERPALKGILEEALVGPERITKQNIERYVVPLLSAGGTKKGKSEVYLFLKQKDEKKIRRAVSLFAEKRKWQKERTYDIVREVKKDAKTGSPLILKGKKGWPLVLCARAASRLCREFEVPVFLYHKGENQSQGSVRGPSDFDILRPLNECRGYLLNGGGHPRAAGFGLKNENLKEFEKCLLENVETGYG